MARGAPGNAGGGGTDDGHPDGANPGGNDENSGGGGGGNGGAGGIGGNSWNSNLVVGGFGGVAFTQRAAGRVVMGGGGGAGARNNDPGDVAASGGAAGGGIVIIRARLVSGTGTINADGAAAYNNTLNDGGGGGGAGGSVVVISLNANPSGLTVTARGGLGGDAWHSQDPNGNPGERYGPGGGGGGGVVLLSGAAASIVVTGGANGITTTANSAFGATPGSAGVSATNITASQIPGVSSGAECFVSPTAVEGVSFNATQYGNRVLLEWQTGEEVDNLGFNIYREERGERVRVNRSLIVGSALMATPGTVFTAGRSYAWQTSAMQSKDSIFWIEEIDLTGRTAWHGPIYSHSSNDGMMTMSAREQAMADQTVTLFDLGNESADAGVTVPVQTVAGKAKLSAAAISLQGASPRMRASRSASSKKAGIESLNRN